MEKQGKPNLYKYYYENTYRNDDDIKDEKERKRVKTLFDWSLFEDPMDREKRLIYYYLFMRFEKNTGLKPVWTKFDIDDPKYNRLENGIHLTKSYFRKAERFLLENGFVEKRGETEYRLIKPTDNIVMRVIHYYRSICWEILRSVLVKEFVKETFPGKRICPLMFTPIEDRRWDMCIDLSKRDEIYKDDKYASYDWKKLF